MPRLMRVLCRYPLVWLLLVAAVGGVAYTFTIPPWQHPDEPTHFEHVRIIAETRHLPPLNYVSLPIRRDIAESMLRHNFWRGMPVPVLDDTTLSQVGLSPLGIYTLAQPKLYYVLAAVWLTPWLGMPVDIQLYSVRILSVILSLVVVACVYKTMHLIFPMRPTLALTATGFVALLPGYTDIMSAVNNDALVNALGAAFFLVLAWAFCVRQRWWAWILLILLLAAAVLTKATGIVLLATTPVAILCYWARNRSSRWFALVIATLLGVGLLAGILALVAYVWPQQAEAWVHTVEQYLRINAAGTFSSLLAPDHMRRYLSTAVVVFQSFWAVFGWRHVYIDSVWYALLALACLLALVGVATLVVRRWSRSLSRVRNIYFMIVAFAAVTLTCGAAIVRSQADQGMSGPYLSHGRYIYIALVPLAMLLALGWSALVPERWQRQFTAVSLVVFALFDLACVVGTIVPYYS